MKRSPMPPRRWPMRRRSKRQERRDAEWLAIRERVLLRDGMECQAARFGFALDAPCDGRVEEHHRRLRSQGGTDDDDNLITLCRWHHKLAHEVRRREAEMTGVIVRG